MKGKGKPVADSMLAVTFIKYVKYRGPVLKNGEFSKRCSREPNVRFMGPLYLTGVAPTLPPGCTLPTTSLNVLLQRKASAVLSLSTNAYLDRRLSRHRIPQGYE